MAPATAGRMCDRLGVMPDKAERAKLLDALYRESYAQVGMAFKPEAKEVLEALLDTGLPVHGVTNAHTDMVEARLTKLAPRGRERLRVSGDARKFLIEPPTSSDAIFDALPEAIRVEGALTNAGPLKRSERGAAWIDPSLRAILPRLRG